MVSRNPEDDLKYCTHLIEENAKDLYLSVLLAPPDLQTVLTALYAFHVEITNITLTQGEPVTRQMKLQWWREVLSGERVDEGQGNPVARSLLRVMEIHELPLSPLVSKVDAHVFDLYNDPMGERHTLEGYLGETRSVLFQLAGMSAGESDDTQLADACGHAGVSTGILSIIQNLYRSHRLQQVYIPSDLLAAAGLTLDGYFAEPKQNHVVLLDGMVNLALEHHSKALLAVDALPDSHRSLFNPLALVPPYVKAIQKAGLNIYDTPVLVSQIRKQWALWRF